MADTTLITAVDTAHDWKRAFQFFLGDKVVSIYRDTADTPNFLYSSDANATTNNTQISTAVVTGMGAFAEWLNPNIVSPNPYVHLTWLDTTNDKLVYAYINMDTFALSTPVDIVTGLTGMGAGFVRMSATVVVVTSGDIYVVAEWDDGTTLTPLSYRSTTGGASWVATAAPHAASADGNRARQVLAFPASSALADEDFGFLMYNMQGDDLLAYTYDQSLDSWGSATIYNGGSVSINDMRRRWGAGIDTDGGAVAVVWNTHLNTATADLLCYKVTFSATPSGSAKTNVIDNPDKQSNAAVFVDWDTGDWYACYSYATTTYATDDDVYYKVSTDAGATWGTQQKLNVTAGDIRQITCAPAVNTVAGEGGWFQPMWYEDVNTDWITNLDNDIDFTRASGAVQSIFRSGIFHSPILSGGIA